MNALHDILQQYKKGDLTVVDYNIMNAGWVSHNIHEYKPQYFDPLNRRIVDYCDGRINGTAEFNNIAAIELGKWFDKTTRIFYENAANKQLIEWCIEKLIGVPIADSIQKLEMALKLFDRIKYDIPAYIKADQAKRIDVDERKNRR